MRTVILLSAYMIAQSINVAGNGHLVIWVKDEASFIMAYVFLACIVMDLVDFFRNKKA